MTALTPTTPLVADEHDHQLAETCCEWCGHEIGHAPYVSGPGSVDLYHSACWDEVSASTPETEVAEPEQRLVGLMDQLFQAVEDAKAARQGSA